MVRMARAAAKAPSRNGRPTAEAWTTGAAAGARCSIIDHAGSTATTRRSTGS
jgi:hypothetical protein